MRTIHGHFNGTGADVYIELGFIPVRVELFSLESATPNVLIWDKCMLHDTLSCEGILLPKGGGAIEDNAATEGVAIYVGGDTLTSSNQTSTTYGEGVYLSQDTKDYRYYTDSDAGISGDASTETIADWTLDTDGSQTGHFNSDVTGDYIGEGSTIRIKSGQAIYEAAIVSLTASQGSAADEVTLSYDVPSGDVIFIGGKYSWTPTALGKVTKPGFRVSNTTINPNDGMVGFRAYLDL
jgi:hypothetical protein